MYAVFSFAPLHSSRHRRWHWTTSSGDQEHKRVFLVVSVRTGKGASLQAFLETIINSLSELGLEFEPMRKQP